MITDGALFLRQRLHMKWVPLRCLLCFNGLKSLVFKPQSLKTHANDKMYDSNRWQAPKSTQFHLYLKNSCADEYQ